MADKRKMGADSRNLGGLSLGTPSPARTHGADYSLWPPTAGCVENGRSRAAPPLLWTHGAPRGATGRHVGSMHSTLRACPALFAPSLPQKNVGRFAFCRRWVSFNPFAALVLIGGAVAGSLQRPLLAGRRSRSEPSPSAHLSGTCPAEAGAFIARGRGMGDRTDRSRRSQPGSRTEPPPTRSVYSLGTRHVVQPHSPG